MFKNREDAAEKLALALHQYQHQNALVLGIPTGGIEIAYHLAKKLGGELSFIITHQFEYPDNPGTFFGAITEDGTEYISTAAKRHLSLDELELLIEQGKHELERTIKLYREENAFPSIYRRTVIITDDGSSPASALQAVIDVCRERFAERVIVALPTATDRVEQILLEMADEVVVLDKYKFYTAIGDGYEEFNRVTQESALYFLKKWQVEHQPYSLE